MVSIQLMKSARAVVNKKLVIHVYRYLENTAFYGRRAKIKILLEKNIKVAEN